MRFSEIIFEVFIRNSRSRHHSWNACSNRLRSVINQVGLRLGSSKFAQLCGTKLVTHWKLKGLYQFNFLRCPIFQLILLFFYLHLFYFWVSWLCHFSPVKKAFSILNYGCTHEQGFFGCHWLGINVSKGLDRVWIVMGLVSFCNAFEVIGSFLAIVCFTRIQTIEISICATSCCLRRLSQQILTVLINCFLYLFVKGALFNNTYLILFSQPIHLWHIDWVAVFSFAVYNFKKSLFLLCLLKLCFHCMLS